MVEEDTYLDVAFKEEASFREEDHTQYFDQCGEVVSFLVLLDLLVVEDGYT